MIVSNNPLVHEILGNEYPMNYLPEKTYREILVYVRDKVYAGHTLYTHPLSGSVKPNETPYKSIVISVVPHSFEADQAEIISNGIQTFDKFIQKEVVLTESIREDFKLIDYTLLCGAIDFDARAGLSRTYKF